jgi:hypothetical protein
MPHVLPRRPPETMDTHESDFHAAERGVTCA